jgi:hypothetical protein
VRAINNSCFKIEDAKERQDCFNKAITCWTQVEDRAVALLEKPEVPPKAPPVELPKPAKKPAKKVSPPVEKPKPAEPVPANNTLAGTCEEDPRDPGECVPLFVAAADAMALTMQDMQDYNLARPEQQPFLLTEADTNGQQGGGPRGPRGKPKPKPTASKEIKVLSFSADQIGYEMNWG